MSENYDTQVGHSSWLFYHVWTCAQAPPMTVHRMVESKMKKQSEEKVFRQLSISTYIHSCTEYIKAYTFDCVYQFCHVFNWLSIVYECTDASPKHSTLYVGAKKDKKICADHEYLQPLIILIHTRTYSYIRVYTCTYSYILVYTRIYYQTTLCTLNQAGFALWWHTVSAARLCCALLTPSFLSVVSSMVRPPRRGLPRPNCHSHGLTS